MSEHKKVAIFVQNDLFLRPILNELRNRNCITHIIKNFNGSPRAYSLMQDALKWADCAFFDFLHDPLADACEMMNVNCRITARLHGLEVYDPKIKSINWSRVHLITSEPQMIRWQRLKESVPSCRVAEVASEHTINLGVNIAPTQEPKQVFGYNIALMAYTPLPRKRLYTTLETFLDLRLQTKAANKNYPWQLNIRGLDANFYGWRGEEATEYVNFIEELESTAVDRGLGDNNELPIINHRFMEDDVLFRFYDGMDCIIDNSMQEGYHISVLEAMSHGVMPFVHHWLGADKIYPKECLFLTQRELVDKLLAWAELPVSQKNIISRQLQTIVQEHHDEQKLAKEAVDVILGEKQ